MPRRRLIALIAWLAGMLICGIVISRTVFTTDLSAFLPQSPSKEQQVLLDQLRDGMVSRMILIGIEGGDAATRAALSKDMAKRLRDDPVLTSVSNGEPVNAERDRAFLFDNRYLLSPAVTPQRFSAAGLHEALRNSIDLLASPMGMFAKELLPRDPTGEIVNLFEQVAGGKHPHMQNGAWASQDGRRAILLAQTQAPGADIDGQQQAMQHVQQAFDAAAKQQGAAAAGAKLMMTGPGVFSVQSRNTIESEAARLSILSILIIVSLLLAVYRSVSALLLGLLPVVSGALVGVAAVSLGFGVVHGITLGFGTTLIGEAVDYSIYLFVQSRQAALSESDASRNWIAEFWPTIRLGVLISIVGFSSLLLSSFPGLSQLGLYSIAGLVTAAMVTRFILPHLLPRTFHIRDVSAIGARLSNLAQRAPAWRWPALILIALAGMVVLQHRASIWNPELSSLSPVSQADQLNDARLRADLGAPDVRYMIALSGPSREAVLASTEKIAAQLDLLVARGALAGYESPSRYLPSMAAQRLRQAALPEAGLEQALQQATKGLPVRPQLFAPFIADVQAAKQRPLLQRPALNGTSFALAVDSMMYQRGASWHALLPLTAAGKIQGSGKAEKQATEELPAESIRAALAAAGEPGAVLVDLAAESGHLYSSYLREASLLSLVGLAAIAVLLAASLRSVRRAARVLFPLIAAVITVVAALLLSGERLTILHLIGLLLIVAVGSNYALFFVRKESSRSDERAGVSPQTLASLAFANLTTVAGFGLLGFSQVPVLHAIGATVGPGAVLALLYAAVFAGRRGGGHAKI